MPSVTEIHFYGGPVGLGCRNVHICDLRMCTHAYLGFADMHICDFQTCTHAHLGFADVQIRNLRTCTHAHLGFADLHICDLTKSYGGFEPCGVTNVAILAQSKAPTSILL